MARLNAHAPFRELVGARLDRPLTRVELRSLAAHLKKCEACRGADAEYRAQRSALRALSQPIPPRDMWARTSAALDREVARSTRAAWGRRVTRARRRTQPATALLSTVAAVGVVAALAIFQLAPASLQPTGAAPRPTPFAVEPQSLAFVGLGNDLAIYRMTISEVCPSTAPLDCVASHSIVRTPFGVGQLADVRGANVSLAPGGQRLALVGRQSNRDVIAVVMMPLEEGGVVAIPTEVVAIPTESVGSPEPTETPVETPTDAPTATPAPTDPSTPTPTPADSPAPTDDPTSSNAPGTPVATTAAETPQPTPPPTEPPTVAPTPPPTATPDTRPSSPPESAVPGLTVVSILEDVLSAGSPPAWSRNGQMLAFSAMPSDGSHGPDVYVWSPEDTQARAITSDHASFFASWSGNRIVVSRLHVDDSGAVGTRNLVVDPNTLEERRAGGDQLWLPTVNRQRSQAIVWRGDLKMHDGRPELLSGALYLMDWTKVDPFRESMSESDDDENSATAPPPTPDPEDNANSVQLTPISPERDPNSAPVTDWQAGWSPDGRVLGIWVADSPASNWGRLTVYAMDLAAGQIAAGEPLLGPTLARRGFSLGADRIAWVGPSDDNVDGELRIRTWTSDGVGGLRVVSPDQEEVLPAF